MMEPLFDEPSAPREVQGIRVLDLTGLPPGRMVISYDPGFAETAWAKTRPAATVWDGGLWTDPHPLGPDEQPPADQQVQLVQVATPAQVATRWSVLYGKRGHGPYGPTVWTMAMDDQGQVCGLWSCAPQVAHEIVATITGGAHPRVPDRATWVLERGVVAAA